MLFGTTRSQTDRNKTGPRRRADVPLDSTGPYDVTDYPGRHRNHRRDCGLDWVSTAGLDWVSTARCTGEPLNCTNPACPKHQPAVYADCMARHTPETLVERDGKLVFLGEYYQGEYDQPTSDARRLGPYVGMRL